MADKRIAALRSADKPTFIYGLIDPRNQELRYIGKTVLTPERRRSVHVWRSSSKPGLRHSMSWLASLKKADLAPEVETLEIVPPGADWVEAEQFWIAYFRGLGARLCNHTAGGEGQTGYRQPADVVERRAAKMRGPLHPFYGKPMGEKVKAALAAANAATRADPVRNAKAIAARRAGMSDAMIQAAVARLQATNADPKRWAESRRKAAEAAREPEARARVSEQSKGLWQTKRDQIIAAQNAGKGAEWKAKQSATKREQWAEPDNLMLAAMRRRRRLSETDIAQIKARVAARESQGAIARDFDVDRSMISRIASGQRY